MSSRLTRTPERTYDEPYVPTLYVPVNVNMDSKWPPRVYWVTTAGKRLLCNADTVGQLDFIRVKNVCVQANLVEKRNFPVSTAFMRMSCTSNRTPMLIRMPSVTLSMICPLSSPPKGLTCRSKKEE